MQSQTKIDQLLQRKSLEISEIEAKYYELLKHEFLVRSIEIKKIPDFWYQCLRNHHTLPSIINIKDWEVLEYVDDLTLDEFLSRNKVKTFKLTLDFKPNPFISNNSIWAAVNNDDVKSYTASGIDFKDSYCLEYFENADDAKESFLKMFIGTSAKGIITDCGFVFDVINGIRIDLWEDPTKYYNSETTYT
jgi:Nucleosome assembly protein (NAP)